MKKRRKLILVLSMTLSVYAGDPGAFEIDFYDAGVPSWLDRDKILSGLKSKKVWLGVTSRPEQEGRYITRVFDDSPAKKSGLLVGDIITQESWNALFDEYKPNDAMDFIVLRDKKKITKKIKLGMRDPLVDMLIGIEGDEHHSGGGHRQLHKLSDENRQYVYKNMFLKNKAFDCKNAHKKLSIKMLPDTRFTGHGAQVIVVRGSHRMMFVNRGRYRKVGANTVCVNSADYDGENLTKKKVTKLYWKLFTDQIEHWYDNP